MKYSITLILTLITGLSTVMAGPLQEDLVSAEAKWLLHLDAQRFKDSEVGGFLMSEFVEKNIPPVGPFNLNLQEVLKLVEGITIYGESMNFEEFENDFDGIAVIQAHPDLRAMLEAVIFMALNQAEGEAPFTVVQEEPYKLLDVDGELQAAFFGDNLIAISRKETAINSFAALNDGKLADLSTNETFQSFSVGDGTVTLLAAAEGLENVGNLPQAQILKMASGLLLRLDERDDNLTLDATLTTVDEATARQVRQVLQGILAMAALANLEDMQFSQLLSSARTEANGSNVNLGISLPVADLFAILESLKPEVIEGMDETGGESIGATIIKSSVDGRYLPGNIVDGDKSTYWTSPGSGQWIELRFAVPVNLETLELAWLKPNERQQAFSVEAQAESGEWTEIFSGNSGADYRNSEDVDYQFVPIAVTKAKALRITGNKNTVNHWNSLCEVRINKGSVKPYEVVSISDKKVLPGNLVDGDRETVWDTRGSAISIEGRLDKAALVKEIGIYWTTSGPVSVHLEVSRDSLEWETVLGVQGTAVAGELAKYNVIDKPAKYFRLSPVNDDKWQVPAELVLYGAASEEQ